MLEENHYYPFGLSMSGISDKALKTNCAENKYRYNKGSELQNKEFADGNGLEMYETPLRELDPQLGRWWQADPKTDQAYESVSPYNAMNDDPIWYNDPKGEEGESYCKGLWETVKETIGSYFQAKYEVGEAINNRALKGPGTDFALQTINSAGSTVNGYMNAQTAGAWSTDPAGVLTDNPTAINQSASAFGQADGVVGPSPLHGGPSPDLQLTPANGGNIIPNGISFTPALPSLKVFSQGNAPSLKEQANNLKDQHNDGKNSVTIQTPDKQIRYDLAGKPHNGIETPHYQIYNKNFVNGEMKSKATKDPVPMSQQDLRLVRKYFEYLLKNNK